MKVREKYVNRLFFLDPGRNEKRRRIVSTRGSDAGDVGVFVMETTPSGVSSEAS